jgi:chromate transporter
VLGTHDPTPAHARPSRARALRVLALGLALWLGPMALLLALPGPRVFADQAVFFSEAALVTFGGAYAVLSYLTSASVQTFHWLTAPQMLDGLGLAESTPGPLIMVVCFVGFVGAYHFPGSMSPTTAAVLGGLVATYFTFLPSFLFIFLGAPHIEALRGQRRWSVALRAVTAAVVGVILQLAFFFGQHVLVSQGQLALAPLALAAGAFVALAVFDVDLVPVVLVGALLGLAYKLLGGA